MISDLIHIVEKELGIGSPKSKGNIAFFSPFMSHRKKKLEVNFSDSFLYGIWHCWISDESGYSVYSLFKRLKKSQYLLDYIRELEKPIFDKHRKTYKQHVKSDFKTDNLKLPEEFIPLSNLQTVNEYSAKVLNYLSNRDIKSYDILRYNIGYCQSGDYNDRIIIPNYNEESELNFYMGRYIGDRNTLNYLGPKIPDKHKIIGFENLINFNLPVSLVEGGFDAISMRFNTIPLYGKIVTNKLIYKLIKYKTSMLHIVLDEDAKQRMIDIALYLYNKLLHTKIYLVFLPEELDPSKLGYYKIWKYINKNKILFNPQFLIKYKLR